MDHAQLQFDNDMVLDTNSLHAAGQRLAVLQRCSACSKLSVHAHPWKLSVLAIISCVDPAYFPPVDCAVGSPEPVGPRH